MADPINDSIGVISGVANQVNPYISKAAIAVLILLIGFIIGKLIGNIIKRILLELGLDKFLKSTIGMRFSLEKTIGNLVSYFIYLIAIIMTLNNIGLTTVVLNMVTAAIIVIIVVSVVLAIKDFFPNIISGIRLKKNAYFKEGDEIQIKEVRGTIIYLGLLETRLKTKYDEEVIMPNAIFNKRQLIVRKKNSKIKKRK